MNSKIGKTAKRTKAGSGYSVSELPSLQTDSTGEAKGTAATAVREKGLTSGCFVFVQAPLGEGAAQANTAKAVFLGLDGKKKGLLRVQGLDANGKASGAEELVPVARVSKAKEDQDARKKQKKEDARSASIPWKPCTKQDTDEAIRALVLSALYQLHQNAGPKEDDIRKHLDAEACEIYSLEKTIKAGSLFIIPFTTFYNHAVHARQRTAETEVGG